MVYIVLLLLGLCFGSFVNALVWRLHEQEKKSTRSTRSTSSGQAVHPFDKLRAGSPQSTAKKGNKAKDYGLRTTDNKSLSIVHGRSMCVNCRHALAWYDLLPVFSWLSLRGKCRYCRKPISWQYPLVELLTAALFILSYIFWPNSQLITHNSLLFALWLIFLTCFMALAVYDLRWMLLPNRIVGPLIVLAAVQLIIRSYGSSHALQTLVGGLWGVVCVAGLFYVLFIVSRERWIGGGDVKLGVVLGLLAGGPLNAFLLIFLASLLGSVAGIPLMLAKKSGRSTRLPFGPFLIAATIIVYLFGVAITGWYRRKFLYM